MARSEILRRGIDGRKNGERLGNWRFRCSIRATWAAARYSYLPTPLTSPSTWPARRRPRRRSARGRGCRGRAERNDRADHADHARNRKRLDGAEYAQILVRGRGRAPGEDRRADPQPGRQLAAGGMPAVDRTSCAGDLRDAVREGDAEAGVVLTRPIELAKKVGSEQSGRFVNGLLDGSSSSTPSREADLVPLARRRIRGTI